MERRKIIRLEELSLNAVPAMKQAVYDGWIIRIHGGHTRRGNSVQCLYESNTEISDKIAHCEEIYRGHGRRCIFKLTDATLPSGLDRILAERGYASEGDVFVQTLDLNSSGLPQDPDVETLGNASDEWLSRFCEMYKIKAFDRDPLARMIELILPEHALFQMRIEGEIVACGLGVLEDRTVGLFDIVSHPDHRREGLGRRISESILAWAKTRGANRAYLQVMKVNEPALRLYGKLGFKTAYSYWYRAKE